MANNTAQGKTLEKKGFKLPISGNALGCKHERSLKILLIKVRFGMYPLALKIRLTR